VTKVLLVRHAEPFISGGTRGADWPLTERGRSEASALGTRLSEWLPAVIWTSPARRARETAALIFPSVAPEVWSQLSEVKKPWYASSDEHATAVVKYLRGDVLAGWEHRADVIARIGQLKLALGSFDSIVLVSHGVFITTWLDHEAGIEDPYLFLSNLRMPDAWELDLDERSIDRIP
jgi:broad specificity phosphatase PhoE